jgi:hypothetical protein
MNVSAAGSLPWMVEVSSAALDVWMRMLDQAMLEPEIWLVGSMMHVATLLSGNM